MKIKESEKQKDKWYQQLSNAIALIAVVIALASAFISHQDSNSQTVLSKISNLTDTISKIQDNEIDFMREGRTGNVDRQNVQSSIHVKQAVYIDCADAIISQIPSFVTPAEYNSIANAKLGESDYSGAENYFLKAVKASGGLQVDKVAAYEMLGRIAMVKGDENQCNEDYKAALNILKTCPEDLNIASSEAYLFKMWSFAEQLKGDRGLAQAKLQEGISYFENKPDSFPPKKIELQDLENAVFQFKGQISKILKK